MTSHRFGFTLKFALLTSLAVLAASANAFAFGQLGGVNMVAGGPSDTAYQLDYPGNIVPVDDGSYFVLDRENSKVLRLDAAGKLIDQFGGRGSGTGRLVTPTAMAKIGGGAAPDLLVAEGAGLIKRFTADGTEVASFGGYGNGTGQFNGLGGMAYDPSCGEVFVSDAPDSGGRVQRFSLGLGGLGSPPFGTHLESFGLGTGSADSGVAGKLWYPRGLTFSSDGGRLFVVDSANSRVQTFTWSGNCGSRTFSHGPSMGSIGSSLANFLSGAQGVTVDSTVTPARIYVTRRFLSHTVKLFTATGAAGDPTAGPYNIVGNPADPSDPVAEWGTVVPYGTNPGEGPDDMNEPNTVVATGSNLLVTESGNNRIHRYANVTNSSPFVGPTSLASWGSDSRDDGYFRYLGKLTAAADGGFYAIDQLKWRIQRFDAKGDFVNGFGSYSTGGEDGTFSGSPEDVAVAPDGTVWVSDGSNGRIQHFSANGVHLGNYTGAGGIYPGPLDIDESGNIWFYEWNQRKVIKLSPAGAQLASLGSTGTLPDDDSLDIPGDLAATSDGMAVFVLDSGMNRIKKFSSTDGVTYTRESTSSAGPGSGDGQLSQPSAIDINPATGGLAVASANNNRVELLGADFSFVDKFGTFGLEKENLIRPAGLAYDHWGNLWVADYGNDSVKRYGSAPVVTLSSPAQGTSTASTAALVEYSMTDPAADCDVASGASVPLSVGANTISVTCTNDQGSGSASAVVTRTQPGPLPGTGPGTGEGDPLALKLPKKLKLSKSGKVTFKVTCAVDCTVSAKVKIGAKKFTVKAAKLKGTDRAQAVTLKLSKKTNGRARAALAAKKRVQLQVSLVAKGAKQGKAGSAIMKK